MDQIAPRRKNYKFAFVLLKFLQPVFSILFYVAIFFIALFLILSVIVWLANVDDVDQMLLSPVMHKITLEPGVEKYEVSFGNGIMIVTDIINLNEVKVVLFSGLFVLISTLLTIAPVFRFLSLLLKNINSKEYEKIIDEKNPRYIMFIGLCVFVGSILIRFVMRFYNYYLAAKFLKDAPQEIKLSLGVDVFSGVTGLTIMFIGLIFACVFQRIRDNK